MPPIVLIASLLAVGPQPVAKAAAAPPRPAEKPTPVAPAAAQELQKFVFDKLGYDLEYFDQVLRLDAAGKKDPKLSAKDWQEELKRAKANVPVLRTFQSEQAAFVAGKPFTLPARGEVYRVYTNLLAILNMAQASQKAAYDDVLRYGARVEISDRDNLGKVRDAKAEYYLQLYREFFFYMAAANFRTGRNQDAVSWFARIDADADIKKLEQELAKVETAHVDTKADMLARLSVKPIAVLPLTQNDKREDLAWLSKGLSEVLAADLAQYTELLVVERMQLEKVLGEVQLAQLGVTDEKTAAKVGQQLAAGTLLTGSFSGAGEQVRLKLSLIAAENAVTLAAVESPVDGKDVFKGARELVIRLLGDAGWLDEASVAELRTARAPADATVKDLLEARLLMATKSGEAKKLYEKAVKEDPAYATMFDELKKEFSDVSATLAVLPFVNVTGSANDQWMVRGVSEVLSTDLPKMSFTVVERSQIDELLAQDLNQQVLGVEDAQGVARRVGADFMVLGSLLHQPPEIRIDARFVEVRTGVVSFATSVTNKAGDFSAALVDLSTQIAARFNVELSDAQKAELAARQRSPQEFEKLMRQELAKDALKPKVGPPAPERPSRWLFWTGAVAAVAGAGLGAASFLVADRAADEASFHHALVGVAPSESVRANEASTRDSAASRAGLFSALGWVGIGVGVLGVVAAVVDTLTVPEATTSVQGPNVAAGVAPVPGGAVVGVTGAF